MRNVLLLGGMLVLVGCGAKSPDQAAATREGGDSSGTAVSGVVRKVEVSAGCWQLLAADSTRYELRPGQAPDSILVDGKQVTVTLKPRPDLMSTCMVGQIVDVVP